MSSLREYSLRNGSIVQTGNVTTTTTSSSSSRSDETPKLPKWETKTIAVWVLSVGTSLLSIYLARMLYTFRRGKAMIKKSEEQKSNILTTRTNIPSIRSLRSQLVPMQIWKQFEDAAYRIRDPKQITKQLTNGDKLLLYALYKQITEGNATTANNNNTSKSWNIMAEKAKLDAWTRMRDIPIDVAIQHYVTAVNDFCQKAPSQNNHSYDTSTGGGDDHDDDTITSHSNEGDVEDDVVGTMFAPLTVSRPGIENGGIIESQHNISNDILLLQAAGRNNVPMVRQLLQKGNVNINYCDETGQMALHLAADKGYNDVVQLLIDAGSNVNGVDYDGISILQAAVIAGHVSTCQLLLQNNANPDLPDLDGDTPRSCCHDNHDPNNSDMIALFEKY